MEYTHIKQPFQPVYHENSEILILGSFPSVKSREEGFYYGNPQNRFWKVMAAILGVPQPAGIEEKKQMLLTANIAVWDVIEECDIKGSSDSSIRNVIAADIPGLLQKTGIKRIYANGKTAAKLYEQWILPVTGIAITVLPSTSPANAAYSLERLTEIWKASLGEMKVSTIRMQKQAQMQEQQQEQLQVQTQNVFYQVAVSKAEYCQMLGQAHFRESDMEEGMCVWRELYGEACSKAMPQVWAWYRKGKEKNKITVVMTIGEQYDNWIAGYEERKELLKAYAVECYAMGILRKAYHTFGEQIYQREGSYIGGLQFLEEEQMKKVPDLLKQMEISDVRCNEAFAMVPQKTVVFMTELSNKKKAECTNICQNCNQKNCPNRQENKITGVLNYGYQRILGNKENTLWKED
jgi:hypoxanthine-DNA glycosylase